RNGALSTADRQERSATGLSSVLEKRDPEAQQTDDCCWEEPHRPQDSSFARAGQLSSLPQGHPGETSRAGAE
ncbi:hypothetical protein P7K49_008991, partial [Saguinus oedipus]